MYNFKKHSGYPNYFYLQIIERCFSLCIRVKHEWTNIDILNVERIQSLVVKISSYPWVMLNDGQGSALPW